MFTDINTDSLRPFFEPETIAVLGAPSDSARLNSRTRAELLNKGYKGRIYPVNPEYPEIFGLKCYSSLAEIPGKVDLVIIGIPPEEVCAALDQCRAKGVKAAVLLTSGIGDISPEGRLYQEKAAELARTHGIHLLGPNYIGPANDTIAIVASLFGFVLPDEGQKSVSFVSQSSSVGLFLYRLALDHCVGLNHLVSVGNEADTDFTDFLGYMTGNNSTKLIGGYLEGLKDGRKLRRVAEEAAKVQKPIMILKARHSTAAARTASQHHVPLANEGYINDDYIYDGFFKQTGILRMDNYEDMLVFTQLFSTGRLPRGKNMAILTISGGDGVTLVDAFESYGFTLPMLNETTRAKIEAVLPSFASARNPIDFTDLPHPQIQITCFNALLEDDNIDIIYAMFDLSKPNAVEMARRIIELYNSSDKTIVICPNGRFPGAYEGEGVRELRRAGLPVLINSPRVVRAMAHLADYAEFQRKRKSKEYKIPVLTGTDHSKAALNGLAGVLSEGRSKGLLAMFGIPVTRQNLARNEDEAASMAGQIGYPVVLKVDSPDIPHKTEAGALILNLNSEEEVRKAYSDVLQNAGKYKPDARINGVLVQEMLPEGTEVIIRVTKDPVFGPTIMFGLGGIFAEVLKDVSFRVAPLSPGDALEMIKEIKGYPILKGVRSKQPADVDALVDVIMKVSAMVTELKDHIEELDINPLVIYPAKMGVKAADARVVLRSKRSAANND